MFLFISIVSALLFTHFFLPRVITEIQNPVLQFIKPPKKLPDWTFKHKNYQSDPIKFSSFDGTIHFAYITYSSLDTAKATIIMLHGIRSKKERFADHSRYLADQGFNTVALDLRAHGESGGKHCTFGVKEKKDVKALVDYLMKEKQITHKIGIWGQSLGGAVGIQALALDHRLKFGIIESTFTDFTNISFDYMRYHTGLNFRAFSNYLVNRAGKIANFNPLSARPVEHAKSIHQPMLIVHGTEDQRISIDNGQELFRNLKSTQKEFLKMEGATHLNVWQVGGQAYLNKVLQFIN